MTDEQRPKPRYKTGRRKHRRQRKAGEREAPYQEDALHTTTDSLREEGYSDLEWEEWEIDGMHDGVNRYRGHNNCFLLTEKYLENLSDDPRPITREHIIAKYTEMHGAAATITAGTCRHPKNQPCHWQCCSEYYKNNKTKRIIHNPQRLNSGGALSVIERQSHEQEQNEKREQKYWRDFEQQQRLNKKTGKSGGREHTESRKTPSTHKTNHGNFDTDHNPDYMHTGDYDDCANGIYGQYDADYSCDYGQYD